MKVEIAAIIGIASGAFTMWLLGPLSKAIEPAVTIGASEVTDLIERLKPFAKDPDSDWRGVGVKFTGGGVTVELTTKGGNEYHGKAKTLKDAVGMIADPAPDIREALRTWTPPRP